jgi:hypothetical protein
MGKTIREYPKWVAWEDGFEKKLERGLVSWPKLLGLHDGTLAYAEIWGQKAKRFRKRVLHKAARRQAKHAVQEG